MLWLATMTKYSWGSYPTIVVNCKACDENVVPLLICVNLILMQYENYAINVDLYRI